MGDLRLQAISSLALRVVQLFHRTAMAVWLEIGKNPAPFHNIKNGRKGLVALLIMQIF
jgi:hypothetical protein